MQRSYSGLLAVPTGAHLHMGSLPGVRGPSIAELTVFQDTTGPLSGTVRHNSQQIAALHKSGLYIETPQGELWGWIMP